MQDIFRRGFRGGAGCIEADILRLIFVYLCGGVWIGALPALYCVPGGLLFCGRDDYIDKLVRTGVA